MATDRKQSELRESVIRNDRTPISSLAEPVAAVIHNLNNVLFGILGCAEHVLGRLRCDSDARADVEQIQRAAQSAAAYGKHFLSTHRSPSACALDAVVSDAQCLLQRVLGEQNSLRLRMRARDATLSGEAFHVEQVLLNLVMNARNAMPDGGSVRIHTRALTGPRRVGRTSLSGASRRWVMLRVEDSGRGMDEAACKRAFEPRLSMLGVDAGSGLGLPSVRAMVEQAAGRVVLKSRVGVGTSVTVFWPRAEESELALSESLLPAHRTQGVTVLLVEDEALVALSVQHHLVSAGHRVLYARCARQALELAKRHAGSIDLLLTDVVLPGRDDGLAVARTLQSTHPEIAVLYMSAHPRAWLVRQGKLAPGCRTVEKPFTPKQLLDSVSRAIEARPSVAPPSLLPLPPLSAQAAVRSRQSTPDLGAPS